MPTDRGLVLFGVLKRADPALVDPGVTAELECLLDDVLTGRQEMTGAIDAVCDSARRIIGRLGERGADAEDVILCEADGNGGDRPPTAKMRKFAASVAKSKGIKTPAGYTKSAALCRAFLDEHAPRRNSRQGEAGNSGGGRAGAPSRGEPCKAGRARSDTEGLKATGSRRASGPKRARSEPAAGTAQASAGSPTPLRIPYGNKGSGVQHGRAIRSGGLVRAARRGSRRIPRARMACSATTCCTGNSPRTCVRSGADAIWEVLKTRRETPRAAGGGATPTASWRRKDETEETAAGLARPGTDHPARAKPPSSSTRTPPFGS